MRGAQLVQQIEALRAQTGAAKVIIIGHSQGGLDARWAAAHDPDAVAAVITVATPHLGSPVADVASGILPGDSSAALDVLADLFGAAPDSSSSFPAAIQLLTTQGAAAFNAATPNVPGMPYWSVAGRSNMVDASVCPASTPVTSAWDGSVDPMKLELAPVAAILEAAAGSPTPVNDGLVTLDSATWGTFLGCVPADHFDEVCQIAGQSPGAGNDFDCVQMYVNLEQLLTTTGCSSRRAIRGDVIVYADLRDRVAHDVERDVVEPLEPHARLAHVEALAGRLPRGDERGVARGVAVRGHQVDRHVVLLRGDRDERERLAVVGVGQARERHDIADAAELEVLDVAAGMCARIAARRVASAARRSSGARRDKHRAWRRRSRAQHSRAKLPCGHPRRPDRAPARAPKDEASRRQVVAAVARADEAQRLDAREARARRGAACRDRQGARGDGAERSPRAERALAGDLRRFDLADLQTRLANVRATGSVDADRLHAAEQWRTKLLDGGLAAIAEFPGGDPSTSCRPARAGATRAHDRKPAGAGRALFRYLADALRAHEAAAEAAGDNDDDDDDDDD